MRTDGRTDERKHSQNGWMDEQMDGRTDDANSISLQLRRGIKIVWKNTWVTNKISKINLSVVCKPFCSICAYYTHLTHYPDKYDNLELRYTSKVISPAGFHITLGKLLAATL